MSGYNGKGENLMEMQPKLLSEILTEQLNRAARPASADAFSEALARPAWRDAPVLPVVHMAPENLGHKLSP
jgi:hypothetical protein